MIDQIRSEEGGMSYLRIVNLSTDKLAAASAMGLDNHKVFVQSNFISPDVPGYVIAALAARGAPNELSGGFYQWDGPELKDYQPL